MAQPLRESDPVRSSEDPSWSRQLLVRLLSISGVSGSERVIAEVLAKEIWTLGVSSSAIRSDEAHKKSPFGGETGNTIVEIAGAKNTPPVMFSCHLDTPPSAVGCRPTVDNTRQRIINTNRESSLGASSRAGCALLLSTLRHLLAQPESARPPAVFCFFVQEELGAIGSRHFAEEHSKTSAPRYCLNIANGPAGQLVVSGNGRLGLRIGVHGGSSRESETENGCSAALVAARALDELSREGLLGTIDDEGEQGVASIGTIRGGMENGARLPEATLTAEIRGPSMGFLGRVLRDWQRVFSRVARRSRDSKGESVRISFAAVSLCPPYDIQHPRERFCELFSLAEAIGDPLFPAHSSSISDANQLNNVGISTASLRSGVRRPHSLEEYLDLQDFERTEKLLHALVEKTGGP